MIQTEQAEGKAKQLLEAVQAKLQITPNMTRVMANSPAVLEGYLGLNGALGTGQLPVKLRQEIALLTAERNECEYCLSAHAAIGKMAGLTDEEIGAARKGRSEAAKRAAALTFAAKVLDTRGAIDQEDFEAMRSAGFANGEIAEVIAHVALNVFTNYFNKATQVEIDFPRVSLKKTA